MQCKNCGAELPNDCELCPVCGKETTKEIPGRIPRLILGGAAVVLVCFCAVLALLIQKGERQKAEDDIDLASFTLIDPELDADAGKAASLTFSSGSYALTETAGRPLGTYNVSVMSLQELQAMDNDTLFSIWDQAAAGEELYQTIVLENGCGLVFSKGNTTTAVYGKLDANAYIAEVYGTVIRDDSGKITFLSSDQRQSDLLSSEEPQTEGSAVGNVIITTEAQVTAATADTAVRTTEEVPADPAQTVFITDSGEKFHRAGCSFLSESSNAISRAEAEEKGYTACSRCKP